MITSAGILARFAAWRIASALGARRGTVVFSYRRRNEKQPFYAHFVVDALDTVNAVLRHFKFFREVTFDRT
jgi:hypothetical protein